MNKRQTKVIFGAIIIILLGIVAYLSFSDRQGPSSSAVPQATDPETGVITDTATPAGGASTNPTTETGWKLYHDEAIGYEMMVPQDTVKTDIFRSDKGSFDLVVKADQYMYQEFRGQQLRFPIAFMDFHYMDMERSDIGSMGGKRAAIFKAPRGYCDGPGCTEPYIAYAVEASKGNYYVLVFYGDDSLNPIESHILESFKLPAELPLPVWQSFSDKSMNFSFEYPADGKLRDSTARNFIRIDNLSANRTDGERSLKDNEFIFEAGMQPGELDCKKQMKEARKVIVDSLETYRGPSLDGPHPGYAFTACWNQNGHGHTITVNQSTADGTLADSIFNSVRVIIK